VDAVGYTLEDIAGPVELPEVMDEPPKRRGRPRKGE
jgi:hypothetical protein